MTEQEIYRDFIAWLGKTWWGLPDSDQLMPLIKARYSVEEAAFLTGMPFSGNDLAELAELKGRDPAELQPYLDGLAKKGILFRRQPGDTYCLQDGRLQIFWEHPSLPASRPPSLPATASLPV